MKKPQAALARKRAAYQHTFCGDLDAPHEDGARVLADLKRFCRINQGGLVISPTTRVVDPYATIYRAGLRDAYLRIMEFLNLGEDYFPEDKGDAETQATTDEPE